MAQGKQATTRSRVAPRVLPTIPPPPPRHAVVMKDPSEKTAVAQRIDMLNHKLEEHANIIEVLERKLGPVLSAYITESVSDEPDDRGGMCDVELALYSQERAVEAMSNRLHVLINNLRV